MLLFSLSPPEMAWMETGEGVFSEKEFETCQRKMGFSERKKAFVKDNFIV